MLKSPRIITLQLREYLLFIWSVYNFVRCRAVTDQKRSKLREEIRIVFPYAKVQISWFFVSLCYLKEKNCIHSEYFIIRTIKENFQVVFIRPNKINKRNINKIIHNKLPDIRTPSYSFSTKYFKRILSKFKHVLNNKDINFPRKDEE